MRHLLQARCDGGIVSGYIYTASGNKRRDPSPRIRLSPHDGLHHGSFHAGFQPDRRNGLLFKLYGEHLGAASIPVALTGNSPQPAPTQHIVGDLPRTTGSPTYPLDMVAALSTDRKYLTLAVVNATDSEQKFDLNTSGAHPTGNVTLWQMTGKDLAANHVGKAAEVEMKETMIDRAPTTLSVAPISIDIYRFGVAQ